MSPYQLQCRDKIFYDWVLFGAKPLSESVMTSCRLNAWQQISVKCTEFKSMVTSSNGCIFPRYWPFVRGIHPSSVNSPYKGQWRGACFDVFFDLRLNKQFSKQSWDWWFETPSCIDGDRRTAQYISSQNCQSGVTTARNIFYKIHWIDNWKWGTH